MRPTSGRRSAPSSRRTPHSTPTPAPESQFRAGQVDSRAMLALGQVLADRSVQVARFTPMSGETGLSFRRLVLTAQSPEAAVRTERTFDAMATAFRPESVERDGDTLTVVFPTSDPTTTTISAS